MDVRRTHLKVLSLSSTSSVLIAAPRGIEGRADRAHPSALAIVRSGLTVRGREDVLKPKQLKPYPEGRCSRQNRWIHRPSTSHRRSLALGPGCQTGIRDDIHDGRECPSHGAKRMLRNCSRAYWISRHQGACSGISRRRALRNNLGGINGFSESLIHPKYLVSLFLLTSAGHIALASCCQAAFEAHRMPCAKDKWLLQTTFTSNRPLKLTCLLAKHAVLRLKACAPHRLRQHRSS